MARPIEFDREEKLELAMNLFWQKGYQATSMKLLTEAMGLQPGSIYSAFRSKKSLFLDAIENYFQERIARFEALLVNNRTPSLAFHTILKDLIDDVFEDQEGRGCLMVNTLLEMGPHDEELHAKVIHMFSKIEDVFYKGFKLAQLIGEIDRAQDPRILAKLLLINVQGLRVYSNMKTEKQTLEQISEQLLACLNFRTGQTSTP